MSEIASSYPYAAAKVKVLENKLITKDKLNRVIESKDFDAALHVLQELGYGNLSTGHATFEEMIQHELDETDTLLLEISPNDIFTQIMRTDKDYYNLRVLIKLLMLDKSLEDANLFPGNIPVEILRRAIVENNYFELPYVMKDALLYIDAQFTVSNDVSIVGIALDRAYAKQIRDLVKEMGNALIAEYYSAYFDLSNVISFLRIRQAGHSSDVFERVYLKGGSIAKRTFTDVFEVADENIASVLAKGRYSQVLMPAFAAFIKTRNIYSIEKAKDDYLLALLKKHRHDMFGIAPIMCYYIAKQREAAAVRMVMTAKQGGISPDVVTERLKELF